MPDLNNTSLITFRDWTVRVRESKDSAPRLLLMIHGFTGDENSMWVFARNLPENYWIVAPRAPYAGEPGGYSWRPPQAGDLNPPSLERLNSSAKALIRFVDEYSASVGFGANTFNVMGFSQGAAMSSVLAFLYPERIHKVGMLAGFVPDGLEERVTTRPLRDKPFFVAHGTRDETVTIERARDSVALLERSGALVNYCEDDVGHKVSVTCLRALREFLLD